MSSPAETIPSIPRTFLTSGCKPSTELAGNTCTPLFQCTNCTNCIWSSTCIWFEDVSRKHAVCILTAYTGSRDMLQTSICLDLWKLSLIGYVFHSAPPNSGLSYIHCVEEGETVTILLDPWSIQSLGISKYRSGMFLCCHEHKRGI